MKKSVVVSIILGTLATVRAVAADLPVKAPAPVPTPVWNWTGFYLGGNVGGGMGAAYFDLDASSSRPTAGFFSGGVQAGYNYQIGNGLIGIEADLNGNSAFKDTVLRGAITPVFRAGLNTDVSGTIRARAGVVMNNTLLYVTGGAAWANVRQSGAEFQNRTDRADFGQPTGTTTKANGVLWGGVIGAGVEYALSPNWTIGGEFLHTMYADRGARSRRADGTSDCNDTDPAHCVLSNQLTTDVARLRLNYRFGDPAIVQAHAWAPATRAKTAAAAYNWTGFYLGGNAGGGMASAHFADPGFYGATATPTGGFFTGGAQVGYNYQFGSGVIGIEADVNGNSAFSSAVLGGQFSPAMRVGVTADVSGTVRARAGVVANNALFYVTGGAAWANVRQNGVEFDNFRSSPVFGQLTGGTANAGGTLWGGVIGVGIEYAVGSNWTVGGEFLRMVYGDRDANLLQANGADVCSGNNRPAANCVVRSQLSTDVARLRLNYRFGEGGDPAAAYRPTAMAHNWTGFYLGGNAGGGMAATVFTDPGHYASSAMPTRGYFTGGGQAGYNYQFGKGLVGIEADVAGNSLFNSSVISNFGIRILSVGLKADASGTIRARGGLVANNALLYATAGVAWANVSQSGVEFENRTNITTFGQPSGVTANAKATLWGGVIGAGVEYAFGPNWTIGGEFLRTVYRDVEAKIHAPTGVRGCSLVTPSADCVMRSQLTTDVARLRLNYKFGG